MESYDYTAISSNGSRQIGTVTASTTREARDILRTRNLTPTELKLAKSNKNSALKSDSYISHKDRTLATRQLAILLDAATPVEKALEITALQFERSRMRYILLNIRSKLMEGQRISQAMQAYPRIFSALYIAMIASGEVSGRLSEVMERLAVDMEAGQKLRQKILAATIYPMILTLVAVIVVTILLVAVIPKVVQQFDSFGQELPILTRFVINLSQILQSYGVFFAIGLIVLGFGFYRLVKIPANHYRWHAMLMKFPFIGHFISNLNAARFCRTMAGLIDSGIPALSAIETAQHTLRNKIMAKAINTVADKVREGAAMSHALKQSQVFPPIVTQMISGGEAGGNIGLMFAKSAEYLEAEFDTATTIFINLLEPMIIILLSLVVLLIIGAIFLPILQLNTLAF